MYIMHGWEGKNKVSKIGLSVKSISRNYKKRIYLFLTARLNVTSMSVHILPISATSF